jgi:SAM-dependent methyltransferase
MAVSEAFVHAYFDRIYNPTYDFTVGQFTIYRRLLARCIERCAIAPQAEVLCVGVGTGNEIDLLLKFQPDVHITGIDTSGSALTKARRKARNIGRRIRAYKMNAKRLEFPDQSFDNVLCVHLMDFVKDGEAVTREILRVLRPGGHFAITYPSEMEGAGLGSQVIREGILGNLRQAKIGAAVKELAGLLTIGFVALPLLLRTKPQTFNEDSLLEMMGKLGAAGVQIEPHRSYFDYLVTGSKAADTTWRELAVAGLVGGHAGERVRVAERISGRPARLEPAPGYIPLSSTLR